MERFHPRNWTVIHALGFFGAGGSVAFMILMFYRWFDRIAVGFKDANGKAVIEKVAATDLDGWWGFALLFGFVMLGLITWFVTDLTDNRTVDWLVILLALVVGAVGLSLFKDKLESAHIHTASLWCGFTAAGAFVLIGMFGYLVAERFCRAYDIPDREGELRD